MNFLLQVSFSEIVWWKLIIDFYIVWIFTLLAIKLIFSNSRMINFLVIFLILLGLEKGASYLELDVSYKLLKYVTEWYPLLVIIIMAPDSRRNLEMFWRRDNKKEVVIMGNEHSREEIVESVFALSKQKHGALITIEKHNTLDHFADKAIMMHSDISKEVLINIFEPNTPLHDGAVIVRGNKILCAGAYFILSDREVEDKTMGSRHRAALGISEVSDGLTIIVSEETGQVSIAIEGILLKMNDPDKLREYLSMFMR